jgi:hypothetical protein
VNKDFALFQSEFKKWQKLFGLTGYKVYFECVPLEGAFADINVKQDEMVAVVRFNSKLPQRDIPHRDIKRDAKHEAIHLLLARLEMNGRYRYIPENEIYEATEELVNRLMDLIII